MDRSPSPTVTGQEHDGHDLRAVSRRVWPAIWVVFAVVLAVAVADYLTVFLSRVLPGWVWCLTGGGLVLGAALVAVLVDVTAVRRARGRRGSDVVARAVAVVLVGVWVGLLWWLLTRACLDQGCQSVPLGLSLFVLFPVVPLGGLTSIGFLVRRGHRGQD